MQDMAVRRMFFISPAQLLSRRSAAALAGVAGVYCSGEGTSLSRNIRLSRQKKWLKCGFYFCFVEFFFRTFSPL